MIRLALLAALCPCAFLSLVMFDADVHWPDTWPSEFQRHTGHAERMRVATGYRADWYQISFESRDDFEILWPAVVTLLDRGSEITLRSVGDREAKNFGHAEWDCSRPVIRIIAPTATGRVTKPDLDGKDQWLVSGPPWPDDIRDKTGALPEVVHTERIDGKLRWVAGKGGDSGPFIHQCRVDVELVVDGRIIDDLRIQFPEYVTVADKRLAPWGKRP